MERVLPDLPQCRVIRMIQKVSRNCIHIGLIYAATAVFSFLVRWLMQDSGNFNFAIIMMVLAMVLLSISGVGLLAQVLQNTFFIVAGSRVGRTWFVMEDMTLVPRKRGIYGKDRSAWLISLERKSRVYITCKRFRSYGVSTKTYSWVVEFTEPVTKESAHSFVCWINSLPFIINYDDVDDRIGKEGSPVFDHSLPFSISEQKNKYTSTQ